MQSLTIKMQFVCFYVLYSSKYHDWQTFIIGYHLSTLYLFLVKFGILAEVRVNVVLLSKICGS